MSSNKLIADFVQKIGANIGAELELNSNGIISLRMMAGSEMSIFAPDQSDMVLLHSEICSVPNKLLHPHQTAAMLLNAQPAKLGGGAIGYDEAEKRLILTRVTNTRYLTFAAFEVILNEFVSALLWLPGEFTHIK